jgi:hypothetical protein
MSSRGFAVGGLGGLWEGLPSCGIGLFCVGTRGNNGETPRRQEFLNDSGASWGIVA